MQNSGKKSGGFKRTSELLKRRITQASEGRGFSETRLLTHWSSFVGNGLAEKTYPVKISFTLTILTTGPHALEVEMMKTQIKEKVNAAYGYSAVTRINITQTAGIGFDFTKLGVSSEGQDWDPNSSTIRKKVKTSQQVESVQDKDLREALADLEEKVLTKSEESKSSRKQ